MTLNSVMTVISLYLTEIGREKIDSFRGGLLVKGQNG